jgi:hypothetical protein
MRAGTSNGLFGITVVLALTGWCVYRIWRRGMTRATIRGWLLYIVAAILVVASVALSAYSSIEAEVAMRWFVPLATAAFALGYPARESWEFHSLTTYWIVLGLFAAVHFIFFFRVLSSQWRGNPLAIAIVGLPETFLASVIFSLCLGPRQRARLPRNSP